MIDIEDDVLDLMQKKMQAQAGEERACGGWASQQDDRA